ncbi:unnamed protein product [Linum tenue]|uniref:Uncharacterized protein n=1 Tax=Linum tenue TaxID=586396 RepID=A0AAV0L6S8_9ROSI|nr:unnamed protein product [Linum tenue]
MGAGCDPQGRQVQQRVDRRRDERPPRGLRARQAVQPRNGGVAHDQCRRDGRVHRPRIGPNREGVDPVRRVRVWGSAAGRLYTGGLGDGVPANGECSGLGRCTAGAAVCGRGDGDGSRVGAHLLAPKAGVETHDETSGEVSELRRPASNCRPAWVHR